MALDYETLKEEAGKHGVILDGTQPKIRTLVGALAILGYKIVVSSEGSPTGSPFIGLSLGRLEEKELRNRLCEYNGHPKCLEWLLNEEGTIQVLSPKIYGKKYALEYLHRESNKLGEFLYLKL